MDLGTLCRSRDFWRHGSGLFVFKGRFGLDVVSLEFIHWLWHSLSIINMNWAMSMGQLSVWLIPCRKAWDNVISSLSLGGMQIPDPLIPMNVEQLEYMVNWE